MKGLIAVQRSVAISSFKMHADACMSYIMQYLIAF